MIEMVHGGNTLPPVFLDAKVATRPPPPPTTSAALRETDTVEISNVGLNLAREATESSLQRARANAIRAEIRAGTFETPERIRGTVERLLQLLK